MKKQTQLKERGQALVMIAVAGVVLFAFAALAIDGSAVFSDRRHSQNASDTAILAAALAKVQNESKGMNVDWHQAGLDRAKDNSYDDIDPEIVVQLAECNVPITVDGKTFTCQGLPQNAVQTQYIHIVIRSVVHLGLAQVLGWKTITNYTDAVSRATEPIVDSWFDGYAIASLHEGCQSPGDGDPFQLGGNAEVNIFGAGVLVNASCPTQDSLVQTGTSSTMVTTDGGTCVVGTSDNTTGVSPAPVEGCTGVDPSQYQLPAPPDCQNAGTLTETFHNSGIWIATPGSFNSTFPPIQGGGSAIIKVTKGVYCLNDGLSVNAQQTLTTDLDGDGHDGATEGALFYVENGDVTFNGGADIQLHAISQTTSSTFSPYWINLLIYVPESNEADIEISGNSGSNYTGTILAPTSHVHLLGNGGTVGLNSQIISDTVKISGSTEFELNYNDSEQAVIPTNPGIALID